ncbi:MAG: dinitrogenase iron-molybdenum cofactor biosynthesis protein [PVC group bacterium]|nr:dinitrogenase iron-molybdenum cofactor biosynthesis protein [PVC group bacterium]
MIICITAQNDSLDSLVDPRFGRCQNFIFMETETGEFETVENPNIAATGGAGIQSAQLVAEKNAVAVLTGNVGPNAFKTLQAAGIDVFTGLSGTVQEVAEKYKNNELQKKCGPSVGSHFGANG